MAVTRTFARLHFEDLDPMRFEDLCLSIIYRMRRWEKIEHFGRMGKDYGIDILGIELLENGRRNTWHFQCKRYNKLSKTQVGKIVKDYCDRNNSRPDYYFILAGCDVSKGVMDYFKLEAKKYGFNVVDIWTASVIEAKLYAEYQDLLFAFFGVNLSEERNKRIGSIRRNIALKKRMHKDFYKPMTSNSHEEHMSRLEEPWRCFVHSEVLVRSIYDKVYPENGLLDGDKRGYFKAEVFNWYHNGLMVRAYPYVVNARVKYFKDSPDESEALDDYEIVEERLEVIGCIPFENIIEYDMNGDEYYNYPHLFCDFINGSDPFEEIQYYTTSGFRIRNEMIEKIL